ncbi:MAG TPA: hypothetical protein EYH16_05365 [Leucothrix mucor]|nr:hypothetical protein [Leucothrix mucor]
MRAFQRHDIASSMDFDHEPSHPYIIIGESFGLSQSRSKKIIESTNNYEENISDLKQVPDAHKKRLTTNASWLRNTFIKEISDSL